MYAVVGDVVASRRLVDLDRVLDDLARLLAVVNDRVPSMTPLHLVMRDEFGGVYADARGAAEAALRLRLLAGEVAVGTVDGEDEPLDLRVGIGNGTAHDTSSGSPTGTAWYHASDARDAVLTVARTHTWPPSLRTLAHGDDRVTTALLNAYLLCQDQLLERMDARDRRALRGLLDGERQVDIATDLGVTQPAIARRVRDRGAMALHRALGSLPTTRDVGEVPTMGTERAASFLDSPA